MITIAWLNTRLDNHNLKALPNDLKRAKNKIRYKLTADQLIALCADVAYQACKDKEQCK